MPAKKILHLASFLRFLSQRFYEDRCLQIAASLTYTTLLSLVPLIVIALTVISAFPVFSSLMVQLKVFILTNLVPGAASKIITVYLPQFSEKAGRLTALGTALFGVTAFMLMLTIDHAFNMIWRVRRPRPLLQRFLIYWAALTLGPLVIGGSLSLTYYMVSLSLGVVAKIPALGEFVLKLVPVALAIFTFALLYRIVPNRYVPVKHAAIGGLVAGVGLEVVNKIFTAYIVKFSTYTLVYGAFASLPLFLLWVYSSWLAVVAGALVAASLSHWRGGAWQIEKTPGRLFYEVLRILHALYRAQQAGEAVRLQELRDEARLGLEEIEDVLERLSAASWAHRVAGNAWALSRSPADIRIADVFRQFVFKPEDVPAEGELDKRLAVLLKDTSARLDEAMAGSLRELYLTR
ncbi:MAG: YihY family inner membrane protein [Pseudomonadota bacterium]|jgi:membrane protein